MCSINHDLKAVFIHVHKTGGSYIASVLKRFYGFETYYLKRPDHETFCLSRQKNPNQKNYENRVHGVYMYYKTSPHLNAKMGMTPQKWATYYKFTFIRNPYDRMVSGWNHMKKTAKVPIPFDRYVTMKGVVSDMEYIHTFMNQAQHIMNERREMVVNFIGHFERLEEDFDRVLTHLGIYYRIHNPYQRVNSHAHLHYSAYFQHQATLDVVNALIADDLKYFGADYPMIRTLEEMRGEEIKDRKIEEKKGGDPLPYLYVSMDLGDDQGKSINSVESVESVPSVPLESSGSLSGMILMDQALEEIIRGL